MSRLTGNIVPVNIQKSLCACGCGGETEVAPRDNIRFGWVRGEPKPYLRGHMPQPGPWTAIDDATVLALYGSMPACDIGKRLGRSENAVWMRARQLGFDKRGPVARWTDAELADLRRSYAYEPVAVIAERLGRTYPAVQQQAKALGLIGKKMLVIGAVVVDYFRVIDSAEKAYILGLLAADGNVGDGDRVSIGLQVKDKHLVELVRDRIAPQHAISVDKRRSHASFGVQSREMAADLARWGLVPRKSYILSWPDLGEFQRPYVLGYFDGDGWASATRGRYPIWGVCSGSRSFLESLRAYIRSETDVELDQIYTRKGTSLHQMAATGFRAYTIDKWLHQDDGLGLARKRYAPEVTERYANSPTDRQSSWGFTAEYKEAAVEALRAERSRSGGVRHGDITRVAEQIGVNRGNLRRWAIQDGA